MRASSAEGNRRRIQKERNTHSPSSDRYSLQGGDAEIRSLDGKANAGMDEATDE